MTFPLPDRLWRPSSIGGGLIPADAGPDPLVVTGTGVSVAGGAIVLDHTLGGEVTAPADVWTEDAAFSFLYVFEPSALPDALGTFFTKSVNNDDFVLIIFRTTSTTGELRLYLIDGNFLSLGTVNTDEEHRLLVVYDGPHIGLAPNCDIYFDGIFIEKRLCYGGADASALAILGGDPSRRVSASARQIAIWNYALTAEEALEVDEAVVLGTDLLETPAMSNLNSLARLRYGKHTSTSQIDDDTGVTYVFAEYKGDLALSGLKPRKLERDLRRGDNERYPRIVGPDEVPGIGLTLELRGLNTNSGGAVTTAKQAELAPLFDSVFGANGTGGTGTTAVTAGSTSPVLVVASAAAIPVGAGVLFNTSSGWIAREVVSKASNTLTLDRAFPGAVVDGSIVYVAVTWYPDNDAPNHTHVAFDVEHPGLARRKILGALGGLVVDFPANGGLVTCAFDFQGTDYTTPALADPTFSAPSVGHPIPSIDGSFWLEDDERLLRSAKLTVAVAREQKATYSGPNGYAGFHCNGIDVSLEGMIGMGALDAEADDDDLLDLQDEETFDIALQLGTAPGRTVYVRMPAADFDAEMSTDGGQDVIKFGASGRRSGNHVAVPGAARIHLF